MRGEDGDDAEAVWHPDVVPVDADAGSSWRPDVATLDWALSVVDQELVGRAVLTESSRWRREDGSIDSSVLGESAAESVLFPLIRRAKRAQGLPPGSEP